MSGKRIIAGLQEASKHADARDDGRKTVIDVKAELDALSAIVVALAPLTKDERSRILRFVRDKYDVYMGDT